MIRCGSIFVNFSGCGGKLRTKKSFSTPNFPSNYGDNEECIWEMVASPGLRVMLSLEKRFHLEKSENCSKDSVEVVDWSMFVQIAFEIPWIFFRFRYSISLMTNGRLWANFVDEIYPVDLIRRQIRWRCFSDRTLLWTVTVFRLIID